VEPTRASITALGTSVMRAVHTRLDRPPLIDDTWGERLVGESERTILHRAALRGAPAEAQAGLEALGQDKAMAVLARAHPSYGMVVLRTRYAEDSLEEAIARGVRQYVIIGAGMDSFALRGPAFAKDVSVFEVDHPATQGLKLERLRDCGAEPAIAVHYVAADLSVEGLDTALSRSPFDPTSIAFFSLLGVTAYLTREANLKTLRAIASCGAPDSELVFSYIEQRDFDAPADEERRRARDVVEAIGEPWVSGFDPLALPNDLRSTGLTLIEDLGRDELTERYCSDRNDGLAPSVVDRIAHARVAG
jgi:methyltransferase (TIGR00027 family)